MPAPYEGRPWFLPFAGEWFRLQDRLAARSRSSSGGDVSDRCPPFPDGARPEPPTFEILGAEDRDGVLVRDIRVDAPTGEPIEAYLVEPAIVDARDSRAGPRCSPTGSTPRRRTATGRSSSTRRSTGRARHGAAAILPQLTFPWAGDPTGSAADGERIVGEVTRLRRCLDLVAAPARPSIRLGSASSGTTSAAMHAILLATVDRRPAAYVLIAAGPALGRLVPAVLGDRGGPDRLPRARCGRSTRSSTSARSTPAKVLFQFGRSDFFIAPMTGLEFKRAAGEGAELKAYEAEHDMASPTRSGPIERRSSRGALG